MPQRQDQTGLARQVRHATNNLAAFKPLYQAWVTRVYRYIYSMTRNQADAEDLTSQTFLTAMQVLSQLREPEKFVSWLFTIARRKVTDHFRRNSRMMCLDLFEESSLLADSDEKLTSDQRLLLSKLTGNLSEAEIELLRLRFAAEMSFREMAELLGMNESTVKRNYYRLLDHLYAQSEVKDEKY